MAEERPSDQGVLFETAFDASPAAQALLTADEWALVRVNQAFSTRFGLTGDSALQSLLDLLVFDGQAPSPPNLPFDGSARIAGSDGAKVVLSIRALATDGPPMRLVHIGDAVAEKAADQSEDDVAELQRRVRNTLSLVRSIIRRSAEGADSVEDLTAHLFGRLDAMSRVQAMLTHGREGVSLRTLIEEELLSHAALREDKVTISGPEICLDDRPAESISLAIHELATNSIKFGVLGGTGAVHVNWRRAQPGDRLLFSWVESGLPMPPLREASGFGEELLTKSLGYDLRAETHLAFTSDGIAFTLDVPLDHVGRGDRIDPGTTP